MTIILFWYVCAVAAAAAAAVAVDVVTVAASGGGVAHLMRPSTGTTPPIIFFMFISPFLTSNQHDKEVTDDVGHALGFGWRRLPLGLGEIPTRSSQRCSNAAD